MKIGFVKEVTMYSVELKLCKDFNSKDNITKTFNTNDLVKTVQDEMVEYFKISDDVNVKTWAYSNSLEHRLLNVDKTLQQEQIRDGQCLILETQKEDGSWRNTFKRNPIRAEQKIIGTCGVTVPGLCGLANLGNTCFMNSTLQCLSHCPPLAEYFLNNNYLNDLKPDGGLEVDLCKAFGDLLKAMWSGDYTDVSPSSFKWKVGKYAAQFMGFRQHDAQEFLTFLLDGLHEAINRAKKENKPPPVETNHVGSNSDKQVEKSDQELAKETWENYLRKSDSIIVNTFHGLLKSSVVCPVCETVSVKFDPLCYMTLPLPQDSDCVLKVLHVPYDQAMKTVVYRVTTPKFGTVRDVISKIAERVNKSPESFILAEIVNNHFHKFFSLNDSVDKIDSVGTNLMVYDIPVSLNDQYTVAPVCHWEIFSGMDNASNSSSHLGYSEASMFGIPFIVVLPSNPCTYETVYNLICERLGRYFSKKNDVYSGENMNNESEIGLNINDGLFTLYIVNGQNPAEAKKIPNDGSLLKFPECLGKQFLALQWTAKSRKEFYKSDPYVSQDLKNPQMKEKLQLQDCISIFMSTEKLGANDTWNCPKCKVFRRATKKFDLWELPNVLIILLKRFTFNRKNTMARGMYFDSSSLYWWEDKLNANVEFPMTNFRLNDYLINKDHPPVSYDLFGVINHYGTLSGGHYTACAKHKDDKQWYCFDDSRVYPESEEKVMSSSAYILFYMQNNTKQK